MSRLTRDAIRIGAAAGAVAAVTMVAIRWPAALNATTVVLAFLLIVLIVAATSRLLAAVVTSLVAALSFNYFFVPPVRTLSIADPQNWVAFLAFLAVSLIGSNLSSVARARTQEALVRQRELARLFDLTRDVLLMSDSRESLQALARSVARRFDLEYVAIGLASDNWDLIEAGPLGISLDRQQLAGVFAALDNRLDFDAHVRAYSGHHTLMVDRHVVRLVPLRLGVKPIGLLAAVGPPADPGTLDALAAVVAIALERAELFEERKAAEVARRSEELKTALLASLGHDLRTPLTAIRVAASNLQTAQLTADEREQTGLILTEAERLTRVFEDILEMARIDAGAVDSELRWAHPSEIVTTARMQVGRTLANHPLNVDVREDVLLRLDPRLTATALAHVLENAAQYAPEATPIDVTADVTAEGLVLRVRDRGPGITPADLPRLFDRFYRASATRTRVPGTGMGLSIARGLLAVEHGRIWAENCADGGAQFTIAVPAASRSLTAPEEAQTPA
jgi:two-component system sensor histidine kinase KdpD